MGGILDYKIKPLTRQTLKHPDGCFLAKDKMTSLHYQQHHQPVFCLGPVVTLDISCFNIMSAGLI